MAVLVVSYARVHQNEIRQLVEFLEEAIPDIDESVYWDGDFKPGLEWFAQFQKAVRRSPKLFVMWCADARESADVRREYEYALEKRKRVIPVLLDDTPLLEKLAIIHGLDLRLLFKHGRREGTSRLHPNRGGSRCRTGAGDQLGGVHRPRGLCA